MGRGISEAQVFTARCSGRGSQQPMALYPGQPSAMGMLVDVLRWANTPSNKKGACTAMRKLRCGMLNNAQVGVGAAGVST